MELELQVGNDNLKITTMLKCLSRNGSVKPGLRSLMCQAVHYDCEGKNVGDYECQSHQFCGLNVQWNGSLHPLHQGQANKLLGEVVQCITKWCQWYSLCKAHWRLAEGNQSLWTPWKIQNLDVQIWPAAQASWLFTLQAPQSRVVRNPVNRKVCNLPTVRSYRQSCGEWNPTQLLLSAFCVRHVSLAITFVQMGA